MINDIIASEVHKTNGGYRWDKGYYFLINPKQRLVDQLKKDGTNSMFAEKGELNEDAPKNLQAHFFSLDNKTKVVNKDKNKTIDSSKKRFWSNNLSYLNIKIKYLKDLTTIDGFEKQVFKVFEEKEYYLEKITNEVLKNVSDKKSEREQFFKEKMSKQYDYLFSEERKEINKILSEYLRENWEELFDFVSKNFEKKDDDNWLILSINIDNLEKFKLTQKEYIELESSLYYTHKSFLNNDFSVYDEEKNEIVGIPIFEFNANQEKLGIRTSTQKNKMATLLTTEENNERMAVAEFLKVKQGKDYTIDKEGNLHSGLHTGIQFRYTGGGEFEVLENTAFIGFKKEKNIILNARELLKIERTKEINGSYSIVSELMRNLYLIPKKKEEPYIFREERKKAQESKENNSLKEMFKIDAPMLQVFLEKKDDSVMKKYVEKRMGKTVLTLAKYSNQKEGKFVYNLRESLNNLIDFKIEYGIKGGKEMSELLKQDLENREKGVLPTIENDDQFFYYSGQMIKFLVSKSKSKSEDKKYDMVFNSLNIEKVSNLKNTINVLFKKYSHAIHMNFKSFNNLYSQIIGYETDKVKLELEDKEKVMLGITVENVLYHKNQEEKGDE